MKKELNNTKRYIYVQYKINKTFLEHLDEIIFQNIFQEKTPLKFIQHK